jgi:tetratricopeptide (TPR) repeat protein
MYYLLTEISHYRQLKKLSPELIEQISQHIQHLLEQDGGIFEYAADGFYLYSFPNFSAEDDTYICDTLFRLKRYLGKKEDDLYGYTVITEFFSEGQRIEIHEKLKSLALRIEADETFWLGDSAKDFLKNEIAAERQGDVWKVLSRIEGKSIFLGTFTDFVVSPRSVEYILDELFPVITGESEGKIIFFKGNALLEMHEVLYAALEKITGKMETEGWVNISLTPGNEVFSAVEPFRNAINRSMLPIIPDYLNETELMAWNRVRSLLELYGKGQPVTDTVHAEIKTDFVSGFLLYLTAFARMVSQSNSPFFLVCEELQQYKDETLDILINIICKGVPGNDFFPILIIPVESEEVEKKIKNRLSNIEKSKTLSIKKLDYPLPSGVETSGYLSTKIGYKPEIIKFYTDSKERESLEKTYFRILSEESFNGKSKEACRALVFKKLNPIVRTTAFVYIKSWGMITEEDFYRFMKNLGIEKLAVQNAFRELKRRGFIKNSIPYPKEITLWMKEMFPEETKKLISSLAVWFYREWEAGRCLINLKSIQLLHSSNNKNMFLRAFQRYVFRSGTEGRSSVIRDVLYYYPGLTITSGKYAGQFELILKGGKLRCSLLDGDRNTAARLYNRWKIPRDVDSFFVGDLYYLKGKYLMAEWKHSEAMESMKKAVIHYQNTEDVSGLSRANAELGIIMLSQRNLQDAKNYFGIARKSVDPGWNIHCYFRSYILEIISLFLYGNYTRVLDYLSSVKEVTESISVRKWFPFINFLEGRTYMELGRYDDAEKMFTSGLSYCRIYNDINALEVIYRWFARSMIYNEKIQDALIILRERARNRESLFFLSEAYTFMGEYRLGLTSALEAYSLPREHRLFITDPVPWLEGFSFLEDLTVDEENGERVLDRLLRAQIGYLKAKVDDYHEGIDEMRHLTRGRNFRDLDPYRNIYFFLYSEILPEDGDNNLEDKTTVLGKSVKYFQERTSKIDRFADKNCFMKQNVWNSRILTRAKSCNLV